MTIEAHAEQPSRVRLDAYGSGPGLPVVVDADTMLSSIDNHCQTGRPSRIARMGDSPTTPLLASEHVLNEIYRGFPKFVRGAVSLQDLRTCFEEHYLPNIIWVQVANGYGHDLRVTEVTDPSDVPTAHLASLIAPCIVFSEDKSLRRPGFAPEQWRPAAGATVTVIDSQSGQETIAMGAGLPVVGAFKGSLAIGRRVGLPDWAALAMLAAFGWWLLGSGDRRRAIGRFLMPFMDEFARLQQQQRTAMLELQPVVVEPVTPAPTKQMVATILARSREPLLAAEAREELPFRFASTVSLGDIRAVLTSEPEFVQSGRSRWQLGRNYGPAAAS